MKSINRLFALFFCAFLIFCGFPESVFSQVLEEAPSFQEIDGPKMGSLGLLSKGGYISFAQTQRKELYAVDVRSHADGSLVVPISGGFFRCEVGFRMESRSRDDQSGNPNWSLFLGVPLSHMGSRYNSSRYLGGAPVTHVGARVQEFGFGPSIRLTKSVSSNLFISLGMGVEKIQGSVSYQAELGAPAVGKYSNSLDFTGQRTRPSIGFGFYARGDYEFQLAREFHLVSLSGVGRNHDLIPFDDGYWQAVTNVEPNKKLGCWSLKATALF